LQATSNGASDEDLAVGRLAAAAAAAVAGVGGFLLHERHRFVVGGEDDGVHEGGRQDRGGHAFEQRQRTFIGKELPEAVPGTGEFGGRLKADLDGVKRLAGDKRDEATHAPAEEGVQSRDNVSSCILVDLEFLGRELVHGVVLGFVVEMGEGRERR
jgi:hypothetical protein